LVSVTEASAMVAPVVSFTTPERRAVDCAFPVKAPAEIMARRLKAKRNVRQRRASLIEFPFGRNELNESKGVARMQEQRRRAVQNKTPPLGSERAQRTSNHAPFGFMGASFMSGVERSQAKFGKSSVEGKRIHKKTPASERLPGVSNY
jgi:hypothetical protein